jgi:hypothetical protein
LKIEVVGTVVANAVGDKTVMISLFQGFHQCVAPGADSFHY